MIQSLTDLQKGQRLRVIQEFLDFDKEIIQKDSLWTFKEFVYFPYDGGYTFYFEEGGIRFAEIDPDSFRILQSPSSYFEEVD